MTWTFRKKILLGYGGTLALVILVCVWAVINLLELGAASESILRENYKSILAGENMIDAIERQDSSALLLILGSGEQWLKEFRANESLFLQWLGRAKDNITIPGEAQIVAEIEDRYSAYLDRFLKLSALAGADTLKAKDFYRDEIHPLFNSVLKTCVALREINQKTMFEASRRTERVAHRAVWSVAVIGLASMVAGLIWSLLLSSLLSRPIRDLRQAALQMAEGNYTVRVPAGGGDEMAALAEQFNLMAEKVLYFDRLNIERIQEERLKNEAIINSVDEGIVVVDESLNIVNINPTAARIFGISTSQALSRHLLETIGQDQIFAAVKETLETGRPAALPEGQDVLALTPGEETEYYQFSVVPINPAAGQRKSVVLQLRDITRHRELDRMKSEFVMTASHELKTPLMSLGMAIDLLLETAPARLSPKERELLEAAREDAQRLKALVSDLLDLSKIQSGKVAMDLSLVPVRLLAEKALAVMKPQAEQKQVELSLSLPESLPQVKADPNKMVWVLVNLVSNALRYTPAGGHIRLGAEALGPQVHVSVSDDGRGIPYEYQSKIFDKFVQVKGGEDAQGTGLGLAICKEIVRAHGGTIWVESTPGEGSTFTFSLPAA